MIVLDTNVFSALMGADAARVEPWLVTVAGTELFTTAITRAEIRYGLARIPAGTRRENLRVRADNLFAEVADRLLVFDAAAADCYGELVVHRESIGRPISIPDAQIAAITRVHNASIATRNVRDFDECGIRVVNPFGG